MSRHRCCGRSIWPGSLAACGGGLKPLKHRRLAGHRFGRSPAVGGGRRQLSRPRFTRRFCGVLMSGGLANQVSACLGGHSIWQLWRGSSQCSLKVRVRARTGAQGLRRVSKRSIHRTSLDDAEQALDAVTRACLVISGAQMLNGICKEDYAANLREILRGSFRGPLVRPKTESYIAVHMRRCVRGVGAFHPHGAANHLDPNFRGDRCRAVVRSRRSEEIVDDGAALSVRIGVRVGLIRSCPGA